MEEKYKDTLFRHYFNNKEHLLSTLNALLGTNATDPNEIKINTLDGIFFDKVKNDISCEFRGRYLILIEHQSTLNYNMPLRCLFYVSELYKNIIEPDKEKLFHTGMINLPRPEFFVLYNGNRKAPAIQTLKLSDAFKDKNDINLELIVKQYNINEGYNESLINKSVDLKFYCTFVNRVKYNSNLGMPKDEAVHEAYRYCYDLGLQIEYLEKCRQELGGMYWFEYDPELAKKAIRNEAFAEGKAEGKAEGRVEGRLEEKFSMVKSLLTVGTPMEFIIKATGWTEEQILKAAEQN